MRTTKGLLLTLIDEQREIKRRLDPAAKKKADEYDAVEEHIKQISLPVEKTSVELTVEGNAVVTVYYSPIVERIVVDQDGKLLTSARFRAMNSLNLVPYKDMTKVSGSIEKAKTLTKSK